MKQVHRITVDCFLYLSEDEDRVRKALSLITSELPVRSQPIDSYHGAAMHILSAEAGKQPDVKQVLENIQVGMSEDDQKVLLESIDERMDDEGILHLRFDKQAASEQQLVLGYSGDVIKVKIHVASYPFSRERAVEAARELFR